MAEKMFGHPVAGIFGYSHLTGGFAGGQAEYVRVPFADVGPLRIESDLSDEQVLFLSDILPTGYMGAEMCDIEPTATWSRCGAPARSASSRWTAPGCSAPSKVIAIDEGAVPAARWRQRQGTTTINFEEIDVRSELLELTGGRGPDKCIDAVGHRGRARRRTCQRVRQGQAGSPQRRPSGRTRCARRSLSCRSGGIVSVIGVYGGFMDKFPAGSWMNRALTLRTGQCHVQRYMRPLLERIEQVISSRRGQSLSSTMIS